MVKVAALAERAREVRAHDDGSREDFGVAVIGEGWTGITDVRSVLERSAPRIDRDVPCS
jgi:hypothetical protein